jgi:hypothetical protein
MTAKETARTKSIANCQLPVADWVESAGKEIGNWQLAIGNVLVSEEW